MNPPTRVRIIGAGWAGLAAAVAACQRGWHVTLIDASHHPGGRAKRIRSDDTAPPFDNGQHILIGAYRETRALMRTVGVDETRVLMRTPLDIRDAQGVGIRLPDGPAPLNLLAGILSTRDWSMADKLGLLRAALAWQRRGFTCPDDWSVLQLCEVHRISVSVRQTLIEPLCLSALNTALNEASARVFLRVLQDALLSGRGGSDFLLPTSDLSQLFPDAALAWLRSKGACIEMGQTVDAIALTGMLSPHGSAVSAPVHTILATSWRQAGRLTQALAPDWSKQALGLASRGIATVYMRIHDDAFQGLPRPIMALSGSSGPAQFVFCRARLLGQTGVIAAVVSDCQLERAALMVDVPAQIRAQFGWQRIEVLQTLLDPHATFACTPGLNRPTSAIAPLLWACGDYVTGPYPATLEGAVRSGLQVVAQIAQMDKA